MLRQQLNGNDRYYNYESTPRKGNLKNENDDGLVVSEWKLAACGLVFSLFVLICKIYYANRKYLYIFGTEKYFFTLIAQCCD